MIVVALGLVALAVLVWTGRLQKPRGKPPAVDVAEARAVLGVDASATADQIREAYARLMHLNHPDRGGSHGAAARLNAARDRLLKG